MSSFFGSQVPDREGGHGDLPERGEDAQGDHRQHCQREGQAQDGPPGQLPPFSKLEFGTTLIFCAHL